jgi:hypothetical protein
MEKYLLVSGYTILSEIVCHSKAFAERYFISQGWAIGNVMSEGAYFYDFAPVC